MFRTLAPLDSSHMENKQLAVGRPFHFLASLPASYRLKMHMFQFMTAVLVIVPTLCLSMSGCRWISSRHIVQSETSLSNMPLMIAKPTPM